MTSVWKLCNKIVNKLMDRKDILYEKWSSPELCVVLGESGMCIEWLAKRGLIKNSRLCSVCGEPASLLECAQIIDGYRWECNLQECNFRKSIRSESFFDGRDLPLRTIIVVMHYWCEDLQNETVTQLGVSEEDSADICNVIREEFEKNQRRAGAIGGIDENFQPVIVEIGESYFFRGEHRQSQQPEGHWVFGGIERLENGAVGKRFLVAVPNCAADTLQDEILRHILPGSNIISDGWAAYGNIPHIANGIYTHSFMGAENNLVDPNNRELHTQNIEMMLMRAKRKMNRHVGSSRESFALHLQDYVFRSQIRPSRYLFESLLMVIVDKYTI
ncbi:uncharacterized protein LOC143920202 [Arctopsyche grandis]|uniref:uncharacterized protein LOC143920202 n=1 Tax=Arctopsyche grandis TaxID=121162 RepID=UPI00406D8AAF